MTIHIITIYDNDIIANNPINDSHYMDNNNMHCNGNKLSHNNWQYTNNNCVFIIIISIIINKINRCNNRLIIIIVFRDGNNNNLFRIVKKITSL